MISIQQISLPITSKEEKLKEKIAEILGTSKTEVLDFKITKKATDSRKKREMIYFVYSVIVEIKNEEKILKSKTVKKNLKHHRIEKHIPFKYEIQKIQTKDRPIIVGSGPCGLFATLILAKAGANPILIERGAEMTSRIKDVEKFMKTGKLNPKSNIQFGEGGAGTFSDGKLNTLITNPRIKYIFEEFVEAGAPKSILIDAKPHIGTDKLRGATIKIREKILKLGGEIRFNTTLTDLIIEEGTLKGIIVNNSEKIETKNLILAIGYSARDTYEMLHEKGLSLKQKTFSIGVRIEHKQENINKSQYDKFYNHEALSPAKYKLVAHSTENRSVYTFCMCPGGYVMPCSSNENEIVTNGMSEYSQDGDNANSALLVNIWPKDLPSTHPLEGLKFQKQLEEKAFKLGGEDYSAPIQLVGDFLNKTQSTKIGNVTPTYTPSTKFIEMDKCLPDFVCKSLREALPKMDQKIKGFADPNAILTAIESRSSSPIRILRDKETYQSNIQGIYPGGEGAGYAGGIVSSAVDGMLISEKILENLQY